MHRSRTRPTIRLGTVALSFLLAALLLSSVLTAAAQTEPRDDDAALRAAFASLRTAIDDGAPPHLQGAFLAKVDAAEIALLLPAVQMASEVGEPARAHDCAAQQILEALRLQVQSVGEPGRVRVARITDTIEAVVVQLAC